MPDPVKPIPEGARSITPYLTIKNAAKAIDFYKKAFNAEEKNRLEGPEGKIGHAELKIGDSNLMICDEFPSMGGTSPQTIGGTPVMIHLYVEKVDDVVERAVAAGATLERPVKDQFYGDRAGMLTDPFGHKWYVSTHVEDVSIDEIRRRGMECMKEAGDKKTAA